MFLKINYLFLKFVIIFTLIGCNKEQNTSDDKTDKEEKFKGFLVELSQPEIHVGDLFTDEQEGKDVFNGEGEKFIIKRQFNQDNLQKINSIINKGFEVPRNELQFSGYNDGILIVSKTTTQVLLHNEGTVLFSWYKSDSPLCETEMLEVDNYKNIKAMKSHNLAKILTEIRGQGD